MASYKLCTCGYCQKKKLRRYAVRWRDKAGKQRMAHKPTAEESKKLIRRLNIEEYVIWIKKCL